MKKKVSEIEGTELDYWVAKALGYKSDPCCPDALLDQGFWVADGIFITKYEWMPSTKWEQGGPIIERRLIEFKVGDAVVGYKWFANIAIISNCDTPWSSGPTPLIAAMRCCVVSEFGEEVEIEEIK